jgi:hypothetical protein
MELQLKYVIGMEVLSLIKSEMRKKPVPIFIWTRLSHEMLRATASTFGIRGYFEKRKDSEQALIEAILDTALHRDE